MTKIIRLTYSKQFTRPGWFGILELVTLRAYQLCVGEYVHQQFGGTAKGLDTKKPKSITDLPLAALTTSNLMGLLKEKQSGP